MATADDGRGAFVVDLYGTDHERDRAAHVSTTEGTQLGIVWGSRRTIDERVRDLIVRRTGSQPCAISWYVRTAGGPRVPWRCETHDPQHGATVADWLRTVAAQLDGADPSTMRYARLDVDHGSDGTLHTIMLGLGA